MENEFVPYEIALALKELGFDEPCIAFYNGRFLDYKIQGGDICSPYLSKENRGECPNAPLYQQAFRWFREKYNLFGRIVDMGYNLYSTLITKLDDCSTTTIGGDLGFKNYKTYEEAELECLKKLIEIVKS